MFECFHACGTYLYMYLFPKRHTLLMGHGEGLYLARNQEKQKPCWRIYFHQFDVGTFRTFIITCRTTQSLALLSSKRPQTYLHQPMQLIIKNYPPLPSASQPRTKPPPQPKSPPKFQTNHPTTIPNPAPSKPPSIPPLLPFSPTPALLVLLLTTLSGLGVGRSVGSPVSNV